ncbi:SDR family oxidoreductase [Muriicola sp. Z0-33]|uniref:SDR family oxidoreductase n=1 Tax=Muriicola sp. Z0-33 TaxID=2816957 RepID=UPI0022380B53|nr:SDR family oxidoreductase [Muriicola sp. Z0-33]MCW5517242.1 SDR family oxidoreductase [Muriicola sp. Z0-33]
MDLGLKGKVVIISGGGGKKGSIGACLFEHLAKEEAIPVILDISERGLKYADEIISNGGEALFCKTDVTSPQEVQKAIEVISKKYGRIDAVINNVGCNDGIGLDNSFDEFMESIKLNLASYFLVVKFALPHLKMSKGNILNIGSKVALTGQGKTSGYAAAKGGVLGLTREWAVDLLKDGIRCNAVLIAESYTPMYEEWIATLKNGKEQLEAIQQNIPLGKRMTTPEEIASACLFTISERSSHTTGQYIFVDGGYVHLDRALLNN